MARVLIAEDDPLTREAVSRALARQGHQVTSVPDGYAALERLAAETFDLLLSDIAMPGMDGIELALIAAKSWPDVAVLLMTGYDEERERAEKSPSLDSPVLTKPLSLQGVLEAVEGMLRRIER